MNNIGDNDLIKLKNVYSSEMDSTIKNRILMVIHFLENNFDTLSIANFLMISKDQIYYWVKRYRELGLEGLYNKKKSGRPPKIDKEQLIEIVSKSPMELGYSFNSWNYQSILDHIKNTMKINIHPQYIYQLLSNIRWKPVSSSDLEEKEEYYLKFFSYPRTNKGHKVTQAHLDMMKLVASKLDAPIQ